MRLVNLLKRPPDYIIGLNYMSRWFVIPRNPVFNIYLHKYVGSDDDRALHDHPWLSVSFLLKGELKEHMQGDRFRMIKRWRPVFRRAVLAHRLELLSDEAWTLFVTGPRIRQWGFHCPKGWVHWKHFTSTKNHGLIGRGCD